MFDENKQLVYSIRLGPWMSCKAPFSKSQTEFKVLGRLLIGPSLLVREAFLFVQIKSANHGTSCKTKDEYVGHVCKLVSRGETFTLDCELF